MKQILGLVEYELIKESVNTYKIIIHTPKKTNITLQGVTEDDIENLCNHLTTLMKSTPLDVIEARKKNICRICKKPIGKSGVILNFGQEYAHEICVENLLEEME